ncbi:MAG: CRISPR-associated protein Cas5 [Ruminococcus sp.]|nr:CRISPR-associated protein Cas5 [Ruminococcus sp.]MCI6504965.1 CRISPR-associated protein Cas5 [Ruminococcus sp.]
MKAIRLHLKQNSANYRREETVNCRMTYPLPPYSTVIGAIHKACGYTDYHPMQVSIQGKYGSQKTRLFKDNCFLNSLQNDRNTLVKLRNPEMLSTAYDIVAVAQKAQGNDFEKGITINVVNKDLIEEYRFLKRTKRRIDKHKKIVKSLKDKAKKMKADKNISAEEVKAFDKRVKEIDKTYKKYEEVKYTIPYSKFRTLATGPKYYEMLYDIELVIHIVSDENTMQDILDNIYNLTAIGRGEDFVEVLECTETELEGGDIQYDAPNSPFDLYMPIELLDKNIDNIGHNDKTVGMYINGTKYLLPKDYTVENLKGNMRKRNFNRIPVLFNKIEFIDGECDGIYLDKCEGKEYAVFLA